MSPIQEHKEPTFWMKALGVFAALCAAPFVLAVMIALACVSALSILFDREQTV